MAGKTKLVTVTGVEVVEDESGTAGTEPLNVDVGGTGALTERGAAASLLVPYILQQSSVPFSSGNITSETVFASVSVAANALGRNGSLRVTSHWACTSNSNAKTIRHRWSGISGQAFLSTSATTTTGCVAVSHIGQNNTTFGQVASSQVVMNAGYVAASSQGSTAAADTAAATELVITGQKGTGTDTLTLQSYVVELLHKA
jgi:hypothetical protein